MYTGEWWRKVKMLIYEVTAAIIGILLVFVTWLVLGILEILPAPIELQKPGVEQEPYFEQYPAEINYR